MREKGFTLLELLLVLLLVMLITSLIPMLFTIVSQWTLKSSSLHPFEWEVAKSQLLMEVREAEVKSVQNDKLELTDYAGHVITYEKYNTFLRRRVNGTGHEVILQHLKTVNFRLIQQGVGLLVEDVDGTVYKAAFYRWDSVVKGDG